MEKSPEAHRVLAIKKQLQVIVREMVQKIALIAAGERPRVRLRLYLDILATTTEELNTLADQAVLDQVNEDVERSEREEG